MAICLFSDISAAVVTSASLTTCGNFDHFLHESGLAYDDAVRALKLATQQSLGASAQISVVGDHAAITLQNAEPQALAQWLTQARLNARSVPSEARLTRAPSPGPALWNGTLTMALPAK